MKIPRPVCNFCFFGTRVRSKIGQYWAELLEVYCAGFPNVFSFSLLCLRQRNINWFQNDINRINEIDTCVSGLDISLY